MSENTKIDYAGASWNPLGWGCYGPHGTPEEPNRCPFCFAHTMAKRHLRDCPDCNAFIPHWHEKELWKPLGWKKPRRIFLQSMGDLFGCGVSTEQIDDILDIVGASEQHTFLALTKSPERMTELLYGDDYPGLPRYLRPGRFLRNLQLGISITNQQDADERIPWLLKVPTKVRWLSIEPLHSPIDLQAYLPFFTLSGQPPGGAETVKALRNVFQAAVKHMSGPLIDWIVLGAETGNRNGRIHPKGEWVGSIVNQCQAAGIPVFLKNNLRAYYGGPLLQQYPEG